jgi:hypothetical protein
MIPIPSLLALPSKPMAITILNYNFSDFAEILFQCFDKMTLRPKNLVFACLALEVLVVLSE